MTIRRSLVLIAAALLAVSTLPPVLASAPEVPVESP